MRSHRRKRAASTLIRCRLALVADHRFHQEMGQRDESKTVNYMVSFGKMYSNPLDASFVSKSLITLLK